MPTNATSTDEPIPQGDPRLLTTDTAVMLLHSTIPARLAFVAGDSRPRIVPTWFHWTGDELVMGTFVSAPHVTEPAARVRALRADGVIAILCPVGSDTLAGVAIMTVPAEEAGAILDDDPCVRSGMMRREVHPCHGFPGDALPVVPGS